MLNPPLPLVTALSHAPSDPEVFGPQNGPRKSNGRRQGPFATKNETVTSIADHIIIFDREGGFEREKTHRKVEAMIANVPNANRNVTAIFLRKLIRR